MKLLYVVNARMPTEKAHGVQVVKTCEALANLGNEITILVPNRRNNVGKDIFEYYSVPRKFAIKYLPTLDLIDWGKIGFFIQSLTFSISVFSYTLFKDKTPIIYSRDILPLWFLSFLKRNLFFEAHDATKSIFLSRVIRKSAGLIGITQGVKNFLIKKGASENNVLVVPDAVELTQFMVMHSKEDARKKLGLSLDRKIAMYIGLFDDWKGYDIFLKASYILHEQNIDVVMIGGKTEQITSLQKKYPYAKFLGYLPYADLPLNQRAADVLVIPNSGKFDISKYYTSPLKLFAHMASGIPIVASRLPSLLEVLNDSNSYLVESDSAKLLAEKIVSIFKDRKLADTKAQQALIDVQQYSWEKRGERIVKFIEK